MRQVILLLLISLLLALGGLGVFFWAVVTGNYQGLDGILLVLVSLLVALIFSGVSFSLFRSPALQSLVQPLQLQESPDGNQKAPAHPQQKD